MSIYILASVTRAGVTIGGGTVSSGTTYVPRAFGGTLVLSGSVTTGTPILVQLDLMNEADARAYGGASAGEGPYDRYSGYMPALLTLRRGDMIIDSQNVDPLTGALTRYRVIGRPEPFPNGVIQFTCDLVIGT